MNRLRVGLLGAGGIGRRHAQAVGLLSDQMQLVACCGRDPDRTRAFATDFGAPAFVDLDRMITEAAPDLVIVALPPSAHDGEVERLAGAAIHLLVEKPIALDQARADSMVAAAQRSGVVAATGFMYRFGDAVRRWKATDTGRPGLFTGSYHCNALHADWWREEAKSGGQMLEQLIHQIDLVRHLMGEPDSVIARRANLFHRDVPRYDIEDVSAVLFGWDDGRIATLTASNIAVPGIWHKEWAVFSEHMIARFTSWNDALFTPTISGASAEPVGGKTDPFAAQLIDISDAIRERRAPYVPLSEGAATLRLALAARQAADQGREIRMAYAV